MSVKTDILKDFIIAKLKNENKITLEKIQQYINGVKTIIATSVNIATVAISQNLTESDYLNTTEDDYNQIRKELEAYFDVYNDIGVLLSDNNLERDKEWWSKKEKQVNEGYYWERYKKLREEDLPTEVIRTLDIDTDNILDNIENPKSDEFSKFLKHGMVVGHVQSGKTGNYAGVICKAADAGYKFIVVIAGGINNLRNQTQKRINEYFVGKENGKDLKIKNLSKVDGSKQPVSLTTTIKDFNTNDANQQTIDFDNITSPVVLVVKKNVTTLNNINKWIDEKTKDSKIRKHAMLIIDDESDYASVNYKDENDPTKINSQIRKLLSQFEKSSYVAYTATPFANIFIDHKTETEEYGLDLFPKDFIYALAAPSNYMGAKKYFITDDEDLDIDNPHIKNIQDYELNFPKSHKSSLRINELPRSLKEAINLFLLNIAIRHLRGQDNKHNSMLVHTSRFTGVHQQVAYHIDEILSLTRKSLKSFGKLNKPETQSVLISKLKLVYEKYLENKEFKFQEVISKLTDIIQTIFVAEVHQKSNQSLDYSKGPVNVIAVGGTSLSRGFTLEGLSVTYFIRNSQFYDTLMQMGRWFGYRFGYDDLCKVFIPNEIAVNFRRIINATEELMSMLNDMQLLGKTPKEFGLGVQSYPGTKLQITAKNKMREAQEILLKLNLDGTLKENTVLKVDIEERKNILKSFEKLIMKLNLNDYKLEKVGSNFLWRNVDSKLIIDFFEDNDFEGDKYKGQDTFGMLSGFPIKFIKEKLILEKGVVDIAFFSKKDINSSINIGNLQIEPLKRRVIKNKDIVIVNKQKLSTSNPERIILKDPNEKKSSKEIREENTINPLLMLHVFKFYEKHDIHDENRKEEEFLNGLFYSYGISFPKLKNISSDVDKTISLKVNSVYLEQLLKEQEEKFNEEESDYDDIDN